MCRDELPLENHTTTKKTVNKEDPLEMLQGEKRDKKDGRGREERDPKIKDNGKKGENSKKKWMTVNYTR